MKKIYIFVFSLFFIGTVFYITTQGQTNTVKFTDGAKNLDTITAGTDAITKNWADTLIVGSLDKNSGGCRIKLGNFFAQESDIVYFWQGYSWGQATTTATTTAANSCVCPDGTTRVLRRSQGNNTITTLDTTWWKNFYYNTIHKFVLAWTTQCTEYSNYSPCPGEGTCCNYVLNNCKDMLDNGSGPGCAGSQAMSYTEYLYNCVANSEILKQ